MKPLIPIVATSLVLGTCLPARAHHSAAPHFDMEQTVTVEGEVSKFAFVNPHAYVYFDAKDANGKKVQWRCELAARTALEQLGWTSKTFAPGTRLTFKGAPARREKNVCYLTSYIGPDGVEIHTRQVPGAQTKLSADPVEPKPKPAHSIPLERDSAGHPKIGGYWVARPRSPADRPATPPPRPKPSAAGIEAAKSYDQRFDDPAIKCSPANIIFGWTHDRNVNEIRQTDKKITLKYGYMDFVRTIHLDVTQHPARTEPSLGGHSIGRWEGDVLEVDTVGFAPGVLVPLASVLHSNQLHIVERFTLDAAKGTLTRAYTVEDPLYLETPYSATDVMQASDQPYEPYRCVELSGENNKRPADKAKK